MGQFLRILVQAALCLVLAISFKPDVEPGDDLDQIALGQPPELDELKQRQESRQARIRELIAKLVAASEVDISDAQLNEKIERTMLMLGDPSPRVRDRADILLRNAPLRAAPVVEKQYAAMKDVLDPEARSRMDRCIDMFHALSRVQQREKATIEWWVTTALTAYFDIGTNPKWDDAAARYIAGRMNYLDPGTAPEVDRWADELEKSGCDDPLIGYLLVRRFLSNPENEDDQIRQRLIKVASAIQRSEYPVAIKSLVLGGVAMLFDAQGEVHFAKMDAEGYRGQAINDLIRAVTKDRLTLPPEVALQVVTQIFATPEAVAVWTRLESDLSSIEKLASPDSSQMLLLKAVLYRMRGFASSNGIPRRIGLQLPPSDPDFELAGKYLAQAWDKDPQSPQIAGERMMLSIETRDEQAAQLWFTRAMALNPDAYAICNQRLYSLPWDQRLEFCRTLARQENMRGRLPKLLIDWHQVLANNSEEKDVYWLQEDVWRDVQLTYARSLEIWPENWLARNSYAKYCVKCGQWAEAQKQFAIIREKPALSVFGSLSSYNYYRRKAQRHLAGG